MLLGGLMTFLGIFYVTFSAEAEGDYTLRAFAVDMADMLELPSIPGIYETAAHGTFDPADGMTGALPAALEGWTLRGWALSDGTALMATTGTMTTAERRAAANVFAEFHEVARGELSGTLATYARGDERIVVLIRKLAVPKMADDERSLAEREAAQRALVDSGRAPLAVHGVALSGGRPPAPGSARGFERLRAVVAGQIVVQVAANTDRETLVAQLSGLDFAFLNGLADTPDPLVSATKGVAVAPDLVTAEVTRAPAPGFAMTTPAPAGPRSAEDGAERPGTGVCVRRAGVLACQ